MKPALNIDSADAAEVAGEFVDLAGERYYAIRNVDNMAPFFISVVSNFDHWLFVSSSGGLTAGRVSPETALFPYVTVDKIHECFPNTGPRTLLRISNNGQSFAWEPFNPEQDDRYAISRHLYKNLLGNKLCFEEINHDLRLEFRYTWVSSAAHGFSRQCELHNSGGGDLMVDMIDGLQNVLPAGTPRFTQTNSSNLVDAYKWTELDEATGMALYTLYSGITDRAEPCESLKANIVYCLGLDAPRVLISNEQLDVFRRGGKVYQEAHKRGIRGSYFVNQTLDLAADATRKWQIVADIEQSQSQVVALRKTLEFPARLEKEIDASVSQGSDGLARIMAGCDGFQITAEENVTEHHYANVLFNVLRGGYFYDQSNVPSRDFSKTIKLFNRNVYAANRDFLQSLPQEMPYAELLARIDSHGDPQLARLSGEYLPITFGRRHGDPSRPWNQFAIKLRDRHGNPLLSYEGNWRDIFQNWEALAFSYPDFIESIIAKFVNATTMDGYNPYRITKEGIDWEVEEPDNPWSYIGYWGDHQVIYLQKMLELSAQFHPARLTELLRQPLFCYANVPYRIREFDALIADSKSTVYFAGELAERIEERIANIGNDGKLVLDATGAVYQVNLAEKLLVPLLAKLGNLVVDGGIWLNTQRPEWNDANNALVGQGLSMVTLYYMRRYMAFLRELLAGETGDIDLSIEVKDWLVQTAAALDRLRPLLGNKTVTSQQRYAALAELGKAASRYRETVYSREQFSGKTAFSLKQVNALLDDALAAVDHSIAQNVREDGMYHAYNTMNLDGAALEIETLYPMLEGQVAALSAGAVAPEDAVTVLESLFASEVYRADQHSFMLYPDRELPRFLEKNRLPASAVNEIPLIGRMLDAGDGRVIVCDVEGQHRFSAEFENVSDLMTQLDELVESYGDLVEAARQPLFDLFEDTFDHQAFTGRSGTMFGFEGLGSIYWHMVSKLLLAVQENFHHAGDAGAGHETCSALGRLYYRIREGIGFNKTPAEYGAFPTDPYSHTPRHSGARQPGMTGQVKEEVLTRFGELGVRVSNGRAEFRPGLLRRREFIAQARMFRYLDLGNNWQDLRIPADAIAFTWCQVPVIYTLDDQAKPSLTITRADGSQQTLEKRALSADDSQAVFERSGRIRQLAVTLNTGDLFVE